MLSILCFSGPRMASRMFARLDLDVANEAIPRAFQVAPIARAVLLLAPRPANLVVAISGPAMPRSATCVLRRTSSFLRTSAAFFPAVLTSLSANGSHFGILVKELDGAGKSLIKPFVISSLGSYRYEARIDRARSSGNLAGSTTGSGW